MSLIRFLLRCLAWTVLGLAVSFGLLLLAWLPFNLVDAAPRPLPAGLTLPDAHLPPERNAAFALMGLMAESGRDPLATGRALWAVDVAHAALGVRQRAASSDTYDGKRRELLGPSPKPPSGPPLFCKSGNESCADEWFAEVEALAQQRQSFGVLGERCDKLLAGTFEFEEPLHASPAADTPLINWSPMVQCSRWFRSGAVVALSRGQRERALEQIRRADRLQAALWEGSRTLIGHMVSTVIARRTYDTMAAMALREPALAEAMAPWLAAPLDTRIGARRWMQTEAAFQRGTIDHLGRDGMELPPMPGLGEVVLTPWGHGPIANAVQRLALRGIGLQPERTKQRADAAWLREIGNLQYNWPAILAGARTDQLAREGRAPWTTLRWRNTFGEAMTEAGLSGGLSYLARHADHELHREATALVLALQRQRVPAAQRAEATRRSTLASDLLKERLSWDATGRSLNVRTWRAEMPGAGFSERRDAITYTWP